MMISTGVDVPVLAAEHEVVDVAVREAHGRDGHGLALAVLQVQRLLRLRQHVQRPRAHAPVRRHRDQVVRVLAAHHRQAVHRVLHTTLFFKTCFC